MVERLPSAPPPPAPQPAHRPQVHPGTKPLALHYQSIAGLDRSARAWNTFWGKFLQHTGLLRLGFWWHNHCHLRPISELTANYLGTLATLGVPVRELHSLLDAHANDPYSLDNRLARLTVRLHNATRGALTAGELLNPARDLKPHCPYYYHACWKTMADSGWTLQFAHGVPGFRLMTARRTIILDLDSGDPVMGLLGAIDTLRFHHDFSSYRPAFAVLVTQHVVPWTDLTPLDAPGKPDPASEPGPTQQRIQDAWVRHAVDLESEAHARALWRAGYATDRTSAALAGTRQRQLRPALAEAAVHADPILRRKFWADALIATIAAHPLRAVRDQARADAKAAASAAPKDAPPTPAS